MSLAVKKQLHCPLLQEHWSRYCCPDSGADLSAWKMRLKTYSINESYTRVFLAHPDSKSKPETVASGTVGGWHTGITPSALVLLVELDLLFLTHQRLDVISL